MTKNQNVRITRKSDGDKGELSGLTGAIVEVVTEVGHAAEDIKSSIRHVQKARQKGSKAVEPIRRAGKKAIAEVRKRLPGGK